MLDLKLQVETLATQRIGADPLLGRSQAGSCPGVWNCSLSTGDPRGWPRGYGWGLCCFISSGVFCGLMRTLVKGGKGKMRAI